MRERVKHLPGKIISVLSRDGQLKRIIERLRIGQHCLQRGRQVGIEAMSQRRLEGILFSFASEVIAARTEVSGTENRASCDFPFQVKVILQRVRELRMVSRLDDEYRMGERRVLWVGKIREDRGLYG